MDAQSTLRRTIALSDKDMAQVSVQASSDGANPFLETAGGLVIVGSNWRVPLRHSVMTLEWFSS